jgi:glyoxylase-like metal-dependent hydrolase (beta-lactamase superfamily II)
MCPDLKLGGEENDQAPQNTPGKIDSTCFFCSRLNATTFKIVEDDKWSENPIIYVKIYERVIVLVDTGCGGASRDPDASLTSLRRFLETYQVPDNNGLPLNQNGTKDYLVICSHCHYDHIGTDAFLGNFPSSNLLLHLLIVLRLRRDRRIRRLSQVSHMGELLRQTFHRGCR